MPSTINHTPIDPDLVDRIFDYLLSEFPQIAGGSIDKAKRAVRAEFAGERPYLAARGSVERQALAQDVLRLFNGRNATEVARRLGISRPTVYRYLKQAGAALGAKK
jgi:transcriptional regulator of acetoin/glycerol metabolism